MTHESSVMVVVSRSVEFLWKEHLGHSNLFEVEDA